MVVYTGALGLGSCGDGKGVIPFSWSLVTVSTMTFLDLEDFLDVLDLLELDTEVSFVMEKCSLSVSAIMSSNLDLVP